MLWQLGILFFLKSTLPSYQASFSVCAVINFQIYVGDVTETNCTQAPKPTNGRELEKPYRDLVKAGRMERKNEKDET